MNMNPTAYRQYRIGTRAYEHYVQMRANQHIEYVRRMERRWFRFTHGQMTMRAAFEALEGYVDASDPDTSLPNVLHGFQTAEAARAANEPDWFQLTCLIHDVGKIMGVLHPDASDGCTADGAQWGISGDTWVVGHVLPTCKKGLILPHLRTKDEGSRYPNGCGLHKLRFAFGHDEYLYRVLIENETTLPIEALGIIRYHSCYPLHSGGAYKELLGPNDEALLEWVRRFNRYDLYTKHDDAPSVQSLWPYYERLLEKYNLASNLRW